MYHYVVILPAAGSGSRMGASVPKVLLPLRLSDGPERSVLRCSTDAFLNDPRCLRVVVCAPSEYLGRFRDEVGFDPRVTVIQGGGTRQASVLAGVTALRSIPEIPAQTITLVHDAARACVSIEVIQRVVAAVAEHGAAAAAVPIVDSVCRGSSDGAISEYVDRTALWSIQTPQGFLLEELLLAHQQALSSGVEVLDDASLVASSRRVALVEGDRLNIKITQPGDLRVASRVWGTTENDDGLPDRTRN